MKHLRFGILAFGSLCAGAAVVSGWKANFVIGSMTGFFPPHYGYSAYVESAALMLGGCSALPCGVAVLLSGNRDAWLGLIGGWAYLQNKERRLACALLAPVAMIIGLFLKPQQYNDSVRLGIWKAMLWIAWGNPRGVNMANYSIWFLGKRIEKAHSDVLQLLVEQGFALWAIIIACASGALYCVLQGRPTKAKAALLCLTLQSVFDNRLHRPVCVFMYVLIWLAALSDRIDDLLDFTFPPQIYHPQGHKT